jgi:hypothetical protein
MCGDPLAKKGVEKEQAYKDFFNSLYLHLHGRKIRLKSVVKAAEKLHWLDRTYFGDRTKINVILETRIQKLRRLNRQAWKELINEADNRGCCAASFLSISPIKCLNELNK